MRTFFLIIHFHSSQNLIPSRQYYYSPNVCLTVDRQYPHFMTFHEGLLYSDEKRQGLRGTYTSDSRVSTAAVEPHDVIAISHVSLTVKGIYERV